MVRINRREKRKFVRDMKKKGISKEASMTYLTMKEMGLDKPKVPNRFDVGDKVRLDIDAITSSVNFKNKSEKYSEFLEYAKDKVFTVGTANKNMYSLEEHPEWLFWGGDLTEAKENQED